MLTASDLWQVPVLVVLTCVSCFISVWLTIAEESTP
jgi:hypothetical protein